MDKIQLIKTGNSYSCDVGITKKEWMDILQNSKITTPERKEVLLQFYNEPEHRGACSLMGEKGNCTYEELRNRIGQFCGAVREYLNRFYVVNTNGDKKQWPIAMIGYDMEDGTFAWQLRPELVQAIEGVFICTNDYWRFKKVLEMFVSYLEYVSKNPKKTSADQIKTDTIGYDTYIKHIVQSGSLIYSGHGYDGHAIQDYIKEWCTFGEDTICMNVDPRDYQTKRCYLNWWDSSNNIVAKWSDGHIVGLQEIKQLITQKNNNSSAYVNGSTIISKSISCKDLGLFDDLPPNQTLKWFYVNYYKQYNDEKYAELSDLLNQEQMNSEILKIKTILESKKNIILQGAPGTGKTYSTAALAVAICNGSLPESKEDIKKEYDQLREKMRIGFCTFHQSMDYEDFVEGLKPQVVDGGVIYNPEDGIFKQMAGNARANLEKELDIVDCIDQYLQIIQKEPRIIPTKSGKSKIKVWLKEGNDSVSFHSVNSGATERTDALNVEKIKLQAQGGCIENNGRCAYSDAFIRAVKEEFHFDNNNTEPFVLIIDEINRGNISKIFGELITLLEDDKRIGSARELFVTLPYSKELFCVPANLYIIGTMNTTDRSTGSIDYALRRRFAFYTLGANIDVVEHQNSPVANLATTLFKDVYAFVDAHKQSDVDIEDLMIGHSYFLADSESRLKLKVEYEVIPLIKEYIKDGILFCRKDEAEKYFKSWLELHAYTKTNSVSEKEIVGE